MTRPRTIERGLVAVLAALLVTLAAGTTLAAPAASKEVAHARALDDEAVSAYLAGDFQRAVDRLLEAVALAPEEPALQLNLGKSYEALRRRPEAALAFRRYLELAPNAPGSAAIQQKIANLEQEIADQAAAKKREEDAQRARSDKPAAPPAVPPPSAQTSPMPWVTLGAGLAVLGLGATFGLVERGQERAAVSAAAADDATRHHDSATRFAVAANVGYVVGGVLVVAGAVWALVTWRAHPDGASF